MSCIAVAPQLPPELRADFLLEAGQVITQRLEENDPQRVGLFLAEEPRLWQPHHGTDTDSLAYRLTTTHVGKGKLSDRRFAWVDALSELPVEQLERLLVEGMQSNDVNTQAAVLRAALARSLREPLPREVERRIAQQLWPTPPSAQATPKLIDLLAAMVVAHLDGKRAGAAPLLSVVGAPQRPDRELLNSPAICVALRLARRDESDFPPTDVYRTALARATVYDEFNNAEAIYRSRAVAIPADALGETLEDQLIEMIAPVLEESLKAEDFVQQAGEYSGQANHQLNMLVLAADSGKLGEARRKQLVALLDRTLDRFAAWRDAARLVGGENSVSDATSKYRAIGWLYSGIAESRVPLTGEMPQQLVQPIELQEDSGDLIRWFHQWQQRRTNAIESGKQGGVSGVQEQALGVWFPYHVARSIWQGGPTLAGGERIFQPNVTTQLVDIPAGLKLAAAAQTAGQSPDDERAIVAEFNAVESPGNYSIQSYLPPVGKPIKEIGAALDRHPPLRALVYALHDRAASEPLKSVAFGSYLVFASQQNHRLLSEMKAAMEKTREILDHTEKPGESN